MGFGNNNNFHNKKADTSFNQNQYNFGQLNEQKPTEYKSPTFDFNMSENNGGFSLSTKPPTKVETK